jgi:hypothetical protein
MRTVTRFTIKPPAAIWLSNFDALMLKNAHYKNSKLNIQKMLIDAKRQPPPNYLGCENKGLKKQSTTVGATGVRLFAVAHARTLG